MMKQIKILTFSAIFGLAFCICAMAGQLPDTGQTKCFNNYGNEIACTQCYDSEGNMTSCPNCYDSEGVEISCPACFDTEGNAIDCLDCYDAEKNETDCPKCHDSDGNETNCPSAMGFYGQDGSYDINPPAYTKIDEEGNSLSDSASTWAIVKDNVTQLMWEVKQNMNETPDYDNPRDADNLYHWYDPDPLTNGGDEGEQGTDKNNTQTFLKALNDSDFGGPCPWDGMTEEECAWRLPTVKELMTIANRATFKPTIHTNGNEKIFPNTSWEGGWDYYWSSTSYSDPENISQAWYVDFEYGKAMTADKKSTEFRTAAYPVRAVRGKSPFSGFMIDNKDGTVTDTSTGLMWMKEKSESMMSWDDARSYCETMSEAGYDDWRLPNINELHALVDYRNYAPAMDSAFAYAQSAMLSWDYYWTSTSRSKTDEEKSAWMVDFIRGKNGYKIKTSATDATVRAVRGPVPLEGLFDLSEVIMVLKLITGFDDVQLSKYYDVNGDKKMGLEEAIVALQFLAGIRQL